MQTRKPYNNFPQIKSAGRQKDNQNKNMKDLLQTHTTNKTPEKLKKFRKTNLLKIGKTTLHHGNYEDVQNYDQNFIHGVKTVKVDSLQQLLINKENQGFQNEITKEKEKIYFTERMKGLGQTVNRDYQIPEQITNDPKFLYGTQTLKKTEEEILRGKNLYKKSHQDYQPGEQKKRNYEWNVNPVTHTFGKNKNQKMNTVQNCLKDEIPVTKVTKRNLQQMKLNTLDNIGQSKTQRINPQLEFKKIITKSPIGVAECFQYQTAPGQKRILNKKSYENDYQTVHGMSTEKISLQKLNQKKTNQDISFFQLLNHNYNQQKKPEQFTKKMQKKDINKLIEMIDVKLSNNQIDEVWKQSENNQMSLNEFLLTCKKLGYVKQKI